MYQLTLNPLQKDYIFGIISNIKHTVYLSGYMSLSNGLFMDAAHMAQVLLKFEHRIALVKSGAIVSDTIYYEYPNTPAPPSIIIDGCVLSGKDKTLDDIVSFLRGFL